MFEVDWQVPVLALLFLSMQIATGRSNGFKCNSALGIGNILTTSMTIPLKLRDSKTGQLKYRFTRLDKYFWTHRRRRNSVSQVGSLYTVFYLISTPSTPLL